MKLLLRSFIAAFVLGTSLVTYATAAGENCAVPLQAASSALREVPGGLSRHEFYELAKIHDDDIAAVKLIAKEYGVESIDSKYFVDYIDGVFLKIKSEKGTPLESAEKMAQFGQKLDAHIAKIATRDGRKSANFAIADAVLTLEEFIPEEYRTAETLPWKDSLAPFVHTDDYMSYAEGYIDNKPPYSNHPWGGGLINFTDIRDGASHNYFPLQMQGHDMRHIHYATGHPRALAAYMKNSRSHNNLRFMLQGAMYEGVDGAQYAHESALTSYMALKRKMDLEEAMVFIAKATNAELEKIVDEAGIRNGIASFMGQYADWAPKLKGDIQATHNGKSLDQEINEYVDRHVGYLQRPELRKYTNFSTNAVPMTGAERQKDLILWSGRISEINNGSINAPEAEPGTVGHVPAAPAADPAAAAPVAPPAQ